MAPGHEWTGKRQRSTRRTTSWDPTTEALHSHQHLPVLGSGRNPSLRLLTTRRRGKTGTQPPAREDRQGHQRLLAPRSAQHQRRKRHLTPRSVGDRRSSPVRSKVANVSEPENKAWTLCKHSFQGAGTASESPPLKPTATASELNNLFRHLRTCASTGPECKEAPVSIGKHSQTAQADPNKGSEMSQANGRLR